MTENYQHNSELKNRVPKNNEKIDGKCAIIMILFPFSIMAIMILSAFGGLYEYSAFKLKNLKQKVKNMKIKRLNTSHKEMLLNQEAPHYTFGTIIHGESKPNFP